MARVYPDLRFERYADDGAPRRREEGIMSRSTPDSLAAQEMRVGPSGSDCRIRVQTTASCLGPMAEVVSVAAKGGSNPVRCALVRRVSEPLLTCRKRRDVAKTR